MKSTEWNAADAAYAPSPSLFSLPRSCSCPCMCDTILSCEVVGSLKKERKKTDNPREGGEDGTPPPHRDFKLATIVPAAKCFSLRLSLREARLCSSEKVDFTRQCRESSFQTHAERAL